MRLKHGLHDLAPRCSAAALVVILAGCAPVPAAEAQASTPLRTWGSVDRVGVYCIVNSPAGDGPVASRALCERIRVLAGRGAPTPVAIVEAGDPALLSAGAVTLLVHGSLQPVAEVAPAAPGRLLVFTIRPFRVTDEDDVLFGTSPRAVRAGGAVVGGPEVDAALNAALSEVLPWRAA